LYDIIGNPFQRCAFHDDGHAALVLPGLQFSPRLTSMPSPTKAASTISGSKVCLGHRPGLYKVHGTGSEP
jgi:hypothetical protein